ncbi:type VI secretion system (T6SS) IcmF/TssM family protein [Desulfobotulus alkaliphilus]|uniref:Type VI secretion system (T6SS) IcmF/TssM family protein n=1 Tax=Desulfobotulus alkaliphilus TaxID=622671 RepID=A0A562RCC0_9BACT|nr:hypothetical protein [Desulfobotulus alkaliphilus]TWI66678.1 type VI secretion system (T6SS) IcmF/TssM family protein [Desulfobotulus alkaliphilus]
MKYLNMLNSFVKSWLQQTLNLPPKVIVIGMALTISLVGLLILWIRKRKKAKEDSSEKSGPDKKPAMPAKSLVRVWKEFLSGIPWRIRRYTGRLPVYVLMGESGSGKTELIRKYTDYEALSLQFQAGHTTSPLFQICLSSKAVLMEMPSGILFHKEADGRRALVKLWKALPGKRIPHGVVCIRGSMLEKETPENLKRLALYLRGKINLMASPSGKPVPLILSLTHMDTVTGYSQWVSFLESQGMSLEAVWNEGSGFPDIERALDIYAAMLPLALTRVPSGDYLAMVDFLENAGRWLGVLSAFTKVLLAEDPFSRTPYLMRMSFHGEGQGLESSGPFSMTAHKESRDFRLGRYRHPLAAGSILAAGILGMAAFFTASYRELEEIDRHLDAMELIKPMSYSELHQFFPMHYGRNIAYRLLPEFFPERKKRKRERLIELIRHHYLYPEYKRLQLRLDDQEKMIYLIALLYSTPKNDLRNLILARYEDWERVLGLPPKLVMDYAIHNTSPPNIDMELSLSRISSSWSWDPAESPLMLHFLLRRLDSLYGDDFITTEVLEGLQEIAAPVQSLVKKVFSFPMLYDVVEIVKNVTPLGADIEWMQRRDLLLRHEQLMELLRYIEVDSVEPPDIRGLSLDAFMELLLSLPRSPATYNEPLTLSLWDRRFEINVQKWNDLVLRSQTTFLMRQFMAEHHQSQGLLFFQGTGEFPDIWLNPSSDGTHFFAGQARIDGRFTRPAFEKRVKRSVEALENQLKVLPVSEGEKERFRDFVQRQILLYAERYAEQYTIYYQRYHLRVDSPAEFRFVLQQIPSMGSPFMNFLMTMKENTMLDVGDSPMLRPVARRMDDFAFMGRVMGEQDGRYPQWETYKGLIARLQEGLREVSFYISQEEREQGAALKERLSPLGRMALDILARSPDSHMAMARMWLGTVGVAPEWQQPFLEPFHALERLGKGEIEERVASLWSDLSERHMKPLQNSFPFHPASARTLPLEALQASLHPDGNFWKQFRAYMGTVCTYGGGQWRGTMGNLRLPADMLATVNGADRIRRVLWDEKGEPRALQLTVRPAILPSVQGGAALPVSTYLRAGRESVFGFNQMPAWQPLGFEWWREGSSAAGMAFEMRTSGRRAYREIAAEPELWSFYRLLQRGRRVEGGAVSWFLESPWGGADFDMVFAFQSDPWALIGFSDSLQQSGDGRRFHGSH